LSGYAEEAGGRAFLRLAAITRGQFVRRGAGVLAGLALGGALGDDARAATGPTPPAGLTALALDGRVVLSWLPVTGASYTVFRGTPTQPDGELLASGLTSATFSDTAVSNGSTYVYAVHATVGGAESGDSNLAQATPLACAVGTGNAIARENGYPGTEAWKLGGRAQAPTGLEGFAAAASIDAGDSVDLKVTTGNAAPYRIEIYRMGYYGGAQGRLVSVLPGLSGVVQPFPQHDYTTGLIDCSNWSVTATLTTTPDWPTGIYLLRLAREDNGADNHILLVVRNDTATAEIGYALSVTTYQAYNDWGGRSLYTFNSSGDNTVAGTPRAVKVSFDRPYNQSLDQEVNFFTQCDIQNVSWLEQQGYDIGYLTGVDVHEGLSLSRFRVLVSPAHDEYWSAEMRDAVTAARDNGGSLVFLGANGAYWKIRFETNPFDGAANRIQVCYKTIESGGPDPSGIPTTTWRDPTVGEPENALIGQMYIGDDDDEFYPLVVTGEQAQNRVWRHTSLQTLDPDASATIGENLVGWEWDARVSNGLEPPGVVTVAASPVTGELLTDAGHTYNPSGSAVSSATVYPTERGGWVFATGTNNWSRGLGLDIGGAGEPSLLVQQATLNALADMGARATTPSDGLVLDELGPPSVVATVPAAATTVPSAGAITARFDRDLDPETVTAATFTLTGPAGAVEAAVSYDGATQTATLTPTPLDAGTTYTATLTTGIEAVDESALAEAVSWTFTLGNGPFSLFPASLVPAVTGTSVQDGRSGSGPWSYELGVKIEVSSAQPLTAVRFYKDPGETGSHVGRIWSATGELLAEVPFANETSSGWQQQELASPLALDADTVYVVSVGLNTAFVSTRSGLSEQIVVGPLQSVEDGQNGVFATAAATFPQQSFSSTNYFVDVVVAGSTSSPASLSVTSTTPTASAAGVGSAVTVGATFSEAVDPSSVDAQSFALGGPSGPVAATVSYDAGSNTALLSPAAPLQPGTTYTATVAASVRTPSGTQLGAPFSWTFTTTTGASLFSSVLTPSLTGLAVQDGRSGSGPFSYELGVKIEVDTAVQLTALRFYKDTGETGAHVGRVWSADGTLLTQVAFTGESASGWQQQSLASPPTLQAGSVYVVSVNANAFFVDTPDALATAIVDAPLRSVADGANGVFGAAAGTFPTGSYRTSNYFVDVVVV